LKTRLHGIIPAMITPLAGEEELNEPALRRLVGFLTDGGVHGLLPLGTTGEAWALSRAERRRVLEVTVEETDGRIPVYAGTGAPSTSEVISLNRDAAEVGGIAAVTVITPFFVTPGQQELYEHYARIADASSLPVILYNNPRFTGLNLNVETVERLARHGNIAGIKDSSANLTQAAAYVTVCPAGFAVFMGADTQILAGLVYGCSGAVVTTGNAAPRIAVDIYEKHAAGDMAGARVAQERLALLRNAMNMGTFPLVVKEALNLMGMDVGPCHRPIAPLAEDSRVKLRDVLRQMGLL